MHFIAQVSFFQVKIKQTWEPWRGSVPYFHPSEEKSAKTVRNVIKYCFIKHISSYLKNLFRSVLCFKWQKSIFNECTTTLLCKTLSLAVVTDVILSVKVVNRVKTFQHDSFSCRSASRAKCLNKWVFQTAVLCPNIQFQDI